MKTYFIQGEDGGPIKIGRSKAPTSRLSDLQGGNPSKLQCIAYIEADVETSLHQKFSRSRLTGEWFRATPALVEYIKQHATTLREFKEHVDDKVEVRLIVNELIQLYGGEWISAKESDEFSMRLDELFGLLNDYGDCDKRKDERAECYCDICFCWEGLTWLETISPLGVIFNFEMAKIILVAWEGKSPLEKRATLFALNEAGWQWDYAGYDLVFVFVSPGGKYRRLGLVDLNNQAEIEWENLHKENHDG